MGNLFETFRQIETGLTRRYEGTGLGLSITKQIVQGHNGRIEVKSKLGVGTSFTVYIPRSMRTVPRNSENP